MTPTYYTNRELRLKIDAILKECASIFANLGTGSDLDLKTDEAADSKEQELLFKIKDLDEEFFTNKLATEPTHDAKTTI